MSVELRLSGMEKLTDGQRAALRRNAGERIQEADAEALQAFFAAAPYGISYYEQEIFYVVMCIMCLWKKDEQKNPKPFAECLKNIKNSDSSDGRFRTLLDSTYQSEDGFLVGKLARLARQIRHGKISQFPDCELLLDDLLKWNNPNKKVQRKWMQVYMSQNNDFDEENK